MTSPWMAAPALAEGVLELVEQLGRVRGIVVDGCPARVGGRDGFIVWDWIVLNEVYFVPNDRNGRIQSFWTGLSDDRARRRFAEAVRRYGIHP